LAAGFSPFVRQLAPLAIQRLAQLFASTSRNPFVVHFLRSRFRRSAVYVASEPSASPVTEAIFQIALDELIFSLPPIDGHPLYLIRLRD
jgi:hypothetical protein